MTDIQILQSFDVPHQHIDIYHRRVILGHTFQQIGNDLGCSRQRVHYLFKYCQQIIANYNTSNVEGFIPVNALNLSTRVNKALIKAKVSSLPPLSELVKNYKYLYNIPGINHFAIIDIFRKLYIYEKKNLHF